MKIAIFSLILLFSIPFSGAGAAQLSDQNYRHALQAIASGQPDVAMNLISRGPDTALNQVITGYAMALPGNSFSFDALASFVSDNPDWPGLKGILMIAEQKLPSGSTDLQVTNWFTAHPPLTPSGFYRFIEVLERTGQTTKANDMIRARWVERDFANDEWSAFYSRFSDVLTLRDHYSRLDRLLWAGDARGARQMERLVGPDVAALADARLALASQNSQAESLVSRVPAKWQNDQGLLYERLRWRRKNGLDDSAVEILNRTPTNLVHADEWWDERNIMLRRLIEKRDYKGAYQLASHHSLKAGQDFATAEFLSGWLALRFLNRADLALEHFDNLIETATTPVTRARGYYWLGRTQEVLGEKQEAQQSYETAASLNTTFYGQLALARLYRAPILKAEQEPSIPQNVRNTYFSQPLIRAIGSLARLGFEDKAFVFFKAAMEAATQRASFVLLAEEAYRLQRPDWAIKAAKAANAKNMILTANAYPILKMNIPSPPQPAFSLALIRQESLFHADAGSGVGAKGLMQLMPATAREVAKKLGINPKKMDLTDPVLNLRLGTAYAAHQLENYDGSYIMALAAYNAGGGRVREWVSIYGDPRTGAIDPIDWIELIPIYETRNYVQRVMENFQVYRARLNHGQAPLTLLQDLKRG